MTLSDLDLGDPRFRTSADVLDEMAAACASNPDLAQFETIGESEEGRPIAGVTLGFGPRLVTLVAGAHADEPVGPETLRTLVLEGLAARGWGAEGGGVEDLWERFTFRIVPHVNPDAEARNQAWITRWREDDLEATLRAYLRHRQREAPGRDVEFGYPDLRVENRAATAFLFDGTPPALHMSLHGMGYSEGALLLVEKGWADRPVAKAVWQGFLDAAARVGLRPHDHDRDAEKGFRYLGPGAWTTPEGRAMTQHFLALDDPETAAQFRLSSMEQAMEAGTGASPLCLVTELPLFHLAADSDSEPGVPELLLRFRERQPELAAAALAGRELAPWVRDLGMRVVPLRDAMRVQLRTIELALEAVLASGPPDPGLEGDEPGGHGSIR